MNECNSNSTELFIECPLCNLLSDLVLQGQGMTQAVPERDLRRQENNADGKRSQQGRGRKPGGLL